MPSYDYECLSCSHTFEVFQSMFDEPLKECPKCGKRVRRVITGGSGIIFKGSGFYVTDNKKSSSIVTDSKKASSGSEAGASTPKEAPSSKETSSPKETVKSPVKSGDKD